MTNEVATIDNIESAIQDLNRTKRLCSELMRLPHYQKIGEAGIFAITEKAKQIGMHPLEAINGGMYFVNGKVEMQGAAMLALIRKHGHSVQIDPKSTNVHVIMHGKRADNGDTWTVHFGIDDAKKAGIYKNVWEKYPQDMCCWRCVSKLGRFLFSDILKGCYVVGEISDAPPLDSPVNFDTIPTLDITPKPSVITTEQADELCLLLTQCEPNIAKRIADFYINPKKYASFYEFPSHLYEELYERLCSERDSYQAMKQQELAKAMDGE